MLAPPPNLRSRIWLRGLGLGASICAWFYCRPVLHSAGIRDWISMLNQPGSVVGFSCLLGLVIVESARPRSWESTFV